MKLFRDYTLTSDRVVVLEVNQRLYSDRIRVVVLEVNKGLYSDRVGVVVLEGNQVM